MSDLVPRRELADFLRTRRARLKPGDVGLPCGTRRRTPGLRREEVAQLSGLSVAWYTWLEQGRPIRISAHAAKRLALALRLNDVEQTHLLTLADLVQPSSPDSPSPCVSDTLRHIIDSQGYNPAYVMNETWQVLAWNRASHLLFGDFGRARFGDANALRYMFLDPDSRRSIVDWEQHARRTAAQFRLFGDRLAGRPDVARLIADLRRGSEDFERYWTVHDVMQRSAGLKEFNHSELGRLSFHHGAFQVNENAELKLVIYVAADETTRIAVANAASHSSEQAQRPAFKAKTSRDTGQRRIRQKR